jgi:hypothetical protein
MHHLLYATKIMHNNEQARLGKMKDRVRAAVYGMPFLYLSLVFFCFMPLGPLLHSITAMIHVCVIVSQSWALVNMPIV